MSGKDKTIHMIGTNIRTKADVILDLPGPQVTLVRNPAADSPLSATIGANISFLVLRRTIRGKDLEMRKPTGISGSVDHKLFSWVRDGAPTDSELSEFSRLFVASAD